MSLAGFLGRLSCALDGAGVAYMVCGSVASFLHGVPRTTQDVDLVIDLAPGGVERLLAEFPEDDFYVSESAVLEAVRSRRQFNIIDMESGWKADLIVRKARPFSAVEFGRRVRASVMGVDVWVASAEDVVLSKLEWAKESGSERQLGDARGVVQVQGDELDRNYLEHWADRLGVSDSLQSILSER